MLCPAEPPGPNPLATATFKFCRMGCVSSMLLGGQEIEGEGQEMEDDRRPGIGHIVSLTSTTYGLLTLDSPQPRSTDTNKGSKRFGLSFAPSALMLTPVAPTSKPTTEPDEVINSWELMEGLDSNDSFRVPEKNLKSTLLHTVAELDSRISRPLKPLNNNNSNPLLKPKNVNPGKENANRAIGLPQTDPDLKSLFKPSNMVSINELQESEAETVETYCQKQKQKQKKYCLEGFEKKCPPGGENAVVVYTTTLRGIRKTFEDCNSVRSALEVLGVWVNERDISMHLRFREELRELIGKEKVTVPRVFVKGRYIGGAEEVLQICEEGGLIDLVEGLPRARAGVCDGCGGVRFLPCFVCSGSCKLVNEQNTVIRCPECNENGLVLCPICS